MIDVVQPRPVACVIGRVINVDPSLADQSVKVETFPWSVSQ
jgi:hypothetical protein